MNKKFAVSLGLLVLIILIGGIAGEARAATDYEVLVKNRNSHAITLSFVGLKVYQFDLPPGNTRIQVERGTYTTSYYGCGKLNFEQLTVKPKDNVLDLDCDAPYDPFAAAKDPNLELLKVRNLAAQTISFLLVGIDNNTDYWFTLTPATNSLYVKPGTYRYSYFACSAYHTGNITVKQFRNTEMGITNCATSANGAANTPNLITFKIKNNTNGDLIVKLNGQFDYLFTVNGPSAYVTAEKGYYTYTLYGCGRTFTGELMVVPNDTILKTPVCSNVAQ